MPSPLEIAKPFANPTERDKARATFRQLGGLLVDVMTAASGGPIPSWLILELNKPLRGFREPRTSPGAAGQLPHRFRRGATGSGRGARSRAAERAG